MICAKCKEENKKSTISGGMATQTLLGWRSYYDEDGKFHSHNPNTQTQYFECSNGHKIIVKRKEECPNCDYGKGTEKIEYTD